MIKFNVVRVVPFWECCWTTILSVKKDKTSLYLIMSLGNNLHSWYDIKFKVSHLEVEWLLNLQVLQLSLVGHSTSELGSECSVNDRSLLAKLSVPGISALLETTSDVQMQSSRQLVPMLCFLPPSIPSLVAEDQMVSLACLGGRMAHGGFSVSS